MIALPGNPLGRTDGPPDAPPHHCTDACGLPCDHCGEPLCSLASDFDDPQLVCKIPQATGPYLALCHPCYIAQSTIPEETP